MKLNLIIFSLFSVLSLCASDPLIPVLACPLYAAIINEINNIKMAQLSKNFDTNVLKTYSNRLIDAQKVIEGAANSSRRSSDVIKEVNINILKSHKALIATPNHSCLRNYDLERACQFFK